MLQLKEKYEDDKHIYCKYVEDDSNSHIQHIWLKIKNKGTPPTQAIQNIVNVGGIFHSLTSPAIVYRVGDASWYKNGRKHRLLGPAIDWKTELGWFYNGIQCISQMHLCLSYLKFKNSSIDELS